MKKEQAKQLNQFCQIARKQAGLSDEDYRHLLLGRFGKVSTTDLSLKQKQEVLDHFAKSGAWKKKGVRPRPTHADSDQIKMVRGLWIELHKAGLVKDGSERALNLWAKRLTGVSALQWASEPKLSKCIEALKSWAKREGLRCQRRGEEE